MKIFLLCFLGVVAVLVLVALSPLLLVYFLFDRLCSVIEEFRPKTKGRRRKENQGQRWEMLKKVFAALPQNVPNPHPTGR